MPSVSKKLTSKEKLINMIDVKLKALGNDNRTLKDVAVDLLHAAGEKDHIVATGCFLCTKTIGNLKEGKTRNPQSDTVARIYKYFGYEMQLSRVHISKKHMNREKS